MRRYLALARGDTRFAAPPAARFVPAKAVGNFVPTLTKKAFEKFGFSAATLITDWTRIAGTELAGYTTPERLRWPRGGEAASSDEDGRPGATLVLRVDPARALDVEYRTRQILDRINGYFGYRAVDTIRLVQAPLPHLAEGESSTRRGEGREGERPDRRRSPPPPPRAPADDPLLAALARLEQEVLRDRARRS